MSMPVRSLPVVQNWDCSGCAQCCRSYHVPVSSEERKRIEAQGWENTPNLKGIPYFAKSGNRFRGVEYRLNHRPDGSCVFLGSDNRCRIHAQFGSAAKPLACRVYPFLLVPSGDHWRLGLRFACPAVAQSQGKPLVEHLSEVSEYAALLEADSPAAIDSPPIPLAPGQIVAWGDLFRIATAVSRLLGELADPLDRRWRRVLGLIALCRILKFGGGDAKKAVTGGRLNELLHVLSQATADDNPEAADEVARPGWTGRVVFRQVAAVYTRKDHGEEKGIAQKRALGRILAAMRFARGKGSIPRVHAMIPDTTFAAVEESVGPLSATSSELLTRYYRLKVESLQFCGPTNFDLPFWDGLESLAMTFPVIMWLSRVLVVGGHTRDEAIRRSVQVVDDNFGFNKLLGMARQKFALRLLGNRGELTKLVAWYAR